MHKERLLAWDTPHLRKKKLKYNMERQWKIDSLIMRGGPWDHKERSMGTIHKRREEKRREEAH